MNQALIALLVAGGCVSALPAAAQQSSPPITSQSPAGEIDCSKTFYTALEPLRSGRAVALGGLHRALRTPDPELPGKWMIAASPTGKQKAPKPERVCVQTKESPGRSPRCIRFESRLPPVPLSLVARAPLSADEARLLKTVGDFIEARGALPDVSNNGRHNFLVQRVAQDIRLYLAQPQHQNLCSGSADLVEFYSAQIAPLKRRMEELKVIATQAKAMAATRVRNIAIAETQDYDKIVAEAAKIEAKRAALLDAYKAAIIKAAEVAASRPTDAAPARPIPEPTLPPTMTVPSRPTGPAEPTDYTVVSFSALISEALRPLLPPDKIKAVADEQNAVKALAKAHTVLLDPQTPTSSATADVRDASLTALRFLEARAYSELYVARFRELDAALFSTIAELKEVQASSCTCSH